MSRAEAREDMMGRIVAAARTLLDRTGDFSLRAVAGELGMTPPALYRYVASHEELERIVAIAIDEAVAARLRERAAQWPADDPLARTLVGMVEFRTWALDKRQEFDAVFTNVDVSCLTEMREQDGTGMFFSDLLAQLWLEYQFPFATPAELDPDLVEILRDPMVPADLSQFPDEMRPLIWLLQRAWSRLYGTVTLEVYGHIDPRIVEQGHLFRSMVQDLATLVDLEHELPRMLALVDELLDA